MHRISSWPVVSTAACSTRKSKISGTGFLVNGRFWRKAEIARSVGNISNIKAVRYVQPNCAAINPSAYYFHREIARLWRNSPTQIIE
jgi:hypothetical protein